MGLTATLFFLGLYAKDLTFNPLPVIDNMKNSQNDEDKAAYFMQFFEAIGIIIKKT
jgi:hypothetical protein